MVFFIISALINYGEEKNTVDNIVYIIYYKFIG